MSWWSRELAGTTTPLDAKHTNLDLARWLDLPVVVAVRPGEEAMNQILSCVQILRGAQLNVAGIVVNAYDAEKASAADEKMLSTIERWTKSRLLAVLPQEPPDLLLGPGIAEAAGKVDWAGISAMLLE